MSDQPNIVDGHGADDACPPGPELARLVAALRRATDLVVRPGALPGRAHHRGRGRRGPRSTPSTRSTQPWRASMPARPRVEVEPHDFFPFSPMIGLYSPLAPPLHCELREGAVVGHAVLGAAYEGPPGCVHGGIIAGLFDELLGVANIAGGVGAMTGTLTITYRSPTPLYTELTLAGHVAGIEGRKVRTEGTLHADDRLCVEAHGIFILVEHERFARLARTHGATTPP